MDVGKHCGNAYLIAHRVDTSVRHVRSLAASLIAVNGLNFPAQDTQPSLLILVLSRMVALAWSVTKRVSHYILANKLQPEPDRSV